MYRGLWNMDYASFFSETTFIEISVYKNTHFFATMDPKRIIKMS